jgi:hypothetical protein
MFGPHLSDTNFVMNLVSDASALVNTRSSVFSIQRYMSEYYCKGHYGIIL